MTTTHVAIALLLAIYDLPWIVIVLVAWSLGGVFSNSAALAMHESSHQLVIPGAVPSVLIGTVASIPLFFPAYASFRHYHKAHHSYNTIEDQGGHNAHSHTNRFRLHKQDLGLLHGNTTRAYPVRVQPSMRRNV